MWAAPAAVSAVVAVAAVSVVVAVPEVLPAQEPAVLARPQREPERVVRARLPVAPVELSLAVAHSAADSAAVVVRLLSRPSFSAAMARSTT